MPAGFEPTTVPACVRGFVSAVAYHFSRQGARRPGTRWSDRSPAAGSNPDVRPASMPGLHRLLGRLPQADRIVFDGIDHAQVKVVLHPAGYQLEAAVLDA